MIRTFFFFVSTLIILTVIGAAGGIYVFYTFGRGLPDYRQLADYKPPVMTRVQAGDGRLLVEYAIQKRVFVPKRSSQTHCSGHVVGGRQKLLLSSRR